MAAPNKTKVERVVTLLARGASVAAIVKSLNVSPQYVYNIRSRNNKQNKNAETVTNAAPQQGSLALEPILTTVSTPTPTLTERPQSIQGEYGKHEQITLWQRIKAVFRL